MNAYLIMAHNNFYILEKLILMLDNPKNDIYIHIDKKVKNFNFNKYRNLTKYSNVYFTKRINVKWGSFSQIKCEYMLMQSAYKKKYQFYHLISGTDLLLKNINEINDFFENSTYKGYIYHDSSLQDSSALKDRIKYYYFFQQILGNSTSYFLYPLYYLNDFLLFLQKHAKVNRLKNNKIKITKAAQWFSLDHDLIQFLISQKKNVYKLFRFSYCSDELFVPTIIDNSEYKNYICEDYKRLIDWKRGGPYTFTINDYDEIINSDKFFARKFNEKTDIEIINKIFEYQQSK